MEPLFASMSAWETGKRQTTRAQPGPGTPNEGLEPVCKQAEVQTHSRNPAALPALGAGLDWQGWHSPADPGIRCWQRAAAVARAEREGRPRGSTEVGDLC